jgi:signal transduction histidine kinase
MIAICDSGPGVPSAAREKIFERLFRLEVSRSTPGNGLGLSLVAAIVNLHRGRIELTDNRPGLNIAITLPRASWDLDDTAGLNCIQRSKSP